MLRKYLSIDMKGTNKKMVNLYYIMEVYCRLKSYIGVLLVAVMILVAPLVIMLDTASANAATYGLLGYETINGRPTGWEWGATQPPPALEPDPANPQLQEVTQDVKEGKQALKATVYPYNNFNRGARAEVVHWDRQHGNYYLFADGQEVEYRWYTKVPTDFPIKSRTWHIITQWHQVPHVSQCWRNNSLTDCGVVPLTFNLNDYDGNGNPALELLVLNKENADGFDRLWTYELTQQDRNRWHEFRLYTKWSACDDYDHSNGRCDFEKDGAFIEFWFNNQKQQLTMPVTPFYNMDDDKTVYMKQGLYHCNPQIHNNCPYSSSDPPLTIYHDGMEFTIWSNVLSSMTITSIDRINGQDRILTPVYQLTQSDLAGNPDWKVFHYVWKENSQHLDVDAIVGIVPFQNVYHVEVGKLTAHAGIKIDISGGQSITIPKTTTWGQPSSGFVMFTLPK